jgi:hypothetical protein
VVQQVANKYIICVEKAIGLYVNEHFIMTDAESVEFSNTLDTIPKVYRWVHVSMVILWDDIHWVNYFYIYQLLRNYGRIGLETGLVQNSLCMIS